MAYFKFKVDGLERTIAEQSLRFYPATFNMLEVLRSRGGPLIEVVTRLTSPRLDPGGSKEGQIVDMQENVTRTTTEILPVPIEVLREQSEQHAKRVQAFANVLLSKETRDLAADLLIDSLRMPGGTSEENRAEITSLPTSIVVEMLSAWAEAQVSGPFAQLVRDLTQGVRRQAEKAMTKLKDSEHLSTIAVGSKPSMPSTYLSEEDTPEVNVAG